MWPYIDVSVRKSGFSENNFYTRHWRVVRYRPDAAAAAASAKPMLSNFLSKMMENIIPWAPVVKLRRDGIYLLYYYMRAFGRKPIADEIETRAAAGSSIIIILKHYRIVVGRHTYAYVNRKVWRNKYIYILYIYM